MFFHVSFSSMFGIWLSSPSSIRAARAASMPRAGRSPVLFLYLKGSHQSQSEYSSRATTPVCGCGISAQYVALLRTRRRINQLRPDLSPNDTLRQSTKVMRTHRLRSKPLSRMTGVMSSQAAKTDNVTSGNPACSTSPLHSLKRVRRPQTNRLDANASTPTLVVIRTALLPHRLA